MRLLVSHAEIDDRQDHENEGLQRYYQDMEDRPGQTESPLQIPGQQGDQDEDQFGRVQVAEQPQGQGNGLGQGFDEPQQHIGGSEPDTERMGQHLHAETPRP